MHGVAKLKIVCEFTRVHTCGVRGSKSPQNKFPPMPLIRYIKPIRMDLMKEKGTSSKNNTKKLIFTKRRSVVVATYYTVNKSSKVLPYFW